jgi:DAACS family dicarboxylate/amino acid:cation (Na+ or H+) symporter/aerobic C4-dicarboxylate transport protein
MAIAKWVGALDTVKMHKALNGDAEDKVPEAVPPESAAVAPSLAINPLRGNLQKTTRA